MTTLESLLNGDRDKFYAVPYENPHLGRDGALTLIYRPECWPFEEQAVHVYDRTENEWRLAETVKNSYNVVIDGAVYYRITGQYNRHDTFYRDNLIPAHTRSNAPENVNRVYEAISD